MRCGAQRPDVSLSAVATASSDVESVQGSTIMSAGSSPSAASAAVSVGTPEPATPEAIVSQLVAKTFGESVGIWMSVSPDSAPVCRAVTVTTFEAEAAVTCSIAPVSGSYMPLMAAAIEAATVVALSPATTVTPRRSPSTSRRPKPPAAGTVPTVMVHVAAAPVSATGTTQMSCTGACRRAITHML